MRITLRILAVVLLCTMIAFPLVCVTQVFLARHEAAELKSALAQLNVGKSTEHDATEVFKDFRAENGQVGGRVFDTVAWGPAYVVSNRSLNILKIAKPTFYYVGFVISKGVVVRKIAGIRVGSGNKCCFFEVEQSSATFTDHPHGIGRSGVFVHKEDGLAHVYVDISASEDDSNAAFDLNLACLTSLAGCTTLNEALPQIRRFNE